MKQELLKGLTEEQIDKVKACKNNEELLKLAKEEGIELTDEQLEVVSGGGCNSYDEPKCPICGSDDNVILVEHGALYHWRCTACNRGFTTKFA
jgi:hypothetical protein